MYTISQLAKRYSLSRSTLIYYDKKGLLTPGRRSYSNYRLYSENDAERLERIILFRSAGIPLSTISEMIDKNSDEVERLLESRLAAINKEIQSLRNQQKVIVEIIKKSEVESGTRVITKEMWVSILDAAGLDEEGMWNWHREFESTSPEAHQDFLESLGLDKKEIEYIRSQSI